MLPLYIDKLVDTWYHQRNTVFEGNDSFGATYKATFFCHYCQQHKPLYLKANNTIRSKCINCNKKAKANVGS